MRRINLYFLNLLGILFLLLFVSAERKSEGPSGLMVEFIRDPGGVPVLDLKPEFTWIVPASAGSQSAYQIMISEYKKENSGGSVTIWDSGKTISSESVEVESGILLSQKTGYSWRVRIWDAKGKLSPWSVTQKFKTGDASGYATSGNRFIANLTNPITLVRSEEGKNFADFGKDAFGTIILKIKSSIKDTLVIHLGEKLSAENSIDRNPGGTIRYQSVKLAISPETDSYVVTLPADKRNTGASAIHLPDSFGIIMPFRYCEIENYKNLLRKEDIFRREYSYYFEDNESDFSCSDTILNRIWNLCKYSIKATSFAGIYIDGDRERIPYEGDAYINQLSHYYTDREYSMARATNEYFIDHPTWPTEWLLHTVLLFYNDLMFTGNCESVKTYYNELKLKTLGSLAREDGLISSRRVTTEIMKSLGFKDPKERLRDIVDWPPAQKDTGWKLATAEGERDGYDMVEVNTVVNAFYYRNLVLLSHIAGIIGYKKDSLKYYNESVRLRKVINEKLTDRKKGIYVDGENSSHSSLHANMMALAFDLVPEELRSSVVSFIKSRGMVCSVYGAQYLLEGLYRSGESDYAFSLLTTKSDRGWWNMIRAGSTITLEAWDMKYKPNSDWNHAWGASPANIIPGFMWGIAPLEPGFKKVEIRPQLTNLNLSTIRVPTIRGTIEAEFIKDGKKKLYTVTIPGNMECHFVTSSGNRIALKPGKNKISDSLQ